MITVIVITLTPFVLYLITYKKESVKLRKFRDELQTGQMVLVNDGITTFHGIVVGKTDDYIRVSGPTGNYAAYGYKCIYPTNKKEEIL